MEAESSGRRGRLPGCRAAPLGIGYRPAEDPDRGFLQAVYVSTRLEELAAVGWPASMRDAFLSQQFEAQHHHYRRYYPDAEWLIVAVGGADVGRLYLETWTNQIRLIDIALLPPARGRGLGAAIIGDLQDEARKAGLKLSVHVEKANPAMRLYRRLGFHAVEDKGVYNLLEWAAITPAAP